MELCVVKGGGGQKGKRFFPEEKMVFREFEYESGKVTLAAEADEVVQTTFFALFEFRQQTLLAFRSPFFVFARICARLAIYAANRIFFFSPSHGYFTFSFLVLFLDFLPNSV